MAYIKYKELTKYYNFSKEIENKDIPEYVYSYIEDEEQILIAYSTYNDMFLLTNNKLIVIDTYGVIVKKQKIHFFPFVRISSTAIEFSRGKASIHLSMDSGYQVRLNFVKLTKEEQEKIKRVYMRMIKTISTKRVRINWLFGLSMVYFCYLLKGWDYMNNKKIIFGIILFLAICFLAFTFANPLESGNGEGTLIQGGENSTNNKNNDDGTEVKSISISGSVKNKIEIGESVNLNATIFPSTALDKKLTYTSSDSKVVSVDQNGVITGVGNGTATITISSGNGKNTTITITVGDDATVADNNQNNATNVNNNGNSGNNNYNRPTQSGGNNSGSSNNNNSGNNGGNNGGGNNGGSTTTPPAVDNTVQVSDINVKVNGNTKLVIGDKTSITSNVVPSNATTKTLTYTSSNNSVVQVDSSGNITAVGAGSATVTITANNGVSKTVTFNILGNSTSDVSVVSDNNSHITSTTSVSGNTVIVNLSVEFATLATITSPTTGSWFNGFSSLSSPISYPSILFTISCIFLSKSSNVIFSLFCASA